MTSSKEAQVKENSTGDRLDNSIPVSKKQQKKILKRLTRYLQKLSLLPKVVKCDNCNRLAVSDVECFSLEYCRRVGIPFTCGSCKCPQYENTLRNPTRGNVGIVYL